jgi:hypothetical protein
MGAGGRRRRGPPTAASRQQDAAVVVANDEASSEGSIGFTEAWNRMGVIHYWLMMKAVFFYHGMCRYYITNPLQSILSFINMNIFIIKI